MSFYRSIFLFIWTLIVLQLPAQNKPTIKASINKNRILIGEPFQLIIETRIPGGSVVKPVKIDTIPHFEFLEKPVIDTIKTGKDITIKGVYNLTSFDSGHWVIPAYSLSSAIKSDTLPVDVVFSEFDPNQDYHDIKDIIPVEQESKKSKWWLYAGAGVLLLALILFLVFRKKAPKKLPAKSATTAFEDAMSQLAKLKASTVAPKEFYTKLIDIFKQYVSRKKEIHSQQKTTDGLVVQLRGLEIPKDSFEKLSQSLMLGDFVKFAKYIPLAEDDNAAFAGIKKGIEEIEQLQ